MSFVLLLLGLFSGVSAAQIEPLDSDATAFSGRDVVRKYRISSEQSFEGRLQWRLVLERRTLVSGELPVRVTPQQGQEVAVRFKLPQLRQLVALQSRLELVLLEGPQPVASRDDPLWLMSDDPFVTRREWLKQQKVHLFDPNAMTQRVFDKSQIPYVLVTTAAEAKRLEGGFLVIGEKTKLDQYPGLAESLMALALRGGRVLCLSPDSGIFSIASLENSAAVGMSFHNEEVIADLDKRMTPLPGAQASAQLARMRLSAKGGEVTLRVNQMGSPVSDGAAGWLWWEVACRASGGGLIVHHFPWIERWDLTPAPSHLLLRTIENFTQAEVSP